MEKMYKAFKLSPLPKTDEEYINGPVRYVFKEADDRRLRESFETIQGCSLAIEQYCEISTEYVILPILIKTY